MLVEITVTTLFVAAERRRSQGECRCGRPGTSRVSPVARRCPSASVPHPVVGARHECRAWRWPACEWQWRVRTRRQTSRSTILERRAGEFGDSALSAEGHLSRRHTLYRGTYPRDVVRWSTTTRAGVSDGANLNALVVCQQSRVSSGDVSHIQTCQHASVPTRRRCAQGVGPSRGQERPRAFYPGPLQCRPCSCAVRIGVDPPHLVDVVTMMGGQGLTDATHQHHQCQTTSPIAAETIRCSTRASTASSARVHPRCATLTQATGVTVEDIA